jgi:uncharacterized SAM-binding protein YcdF (DUF218 family)
MRIDQDYQGFDWDGLFTFLLTLLVIGVTLGLSLIIFYLYAWWVARSTLRTKPANACLLVFGKRLQRGSIDTDYRLRLDKTAEFLVHDPQTRVILLGGAPMHEQLSEAKAGFDYLKAKGVDSPEHIQLEERSRNTLENLRQARKMLERENCADLILITNRYHLARSRMIANSLGLKNRLCPAEAAFSWSAKVIGKLAFEAFYMLWFNTGKSWARLIGSQRMLQRVT